MIHDTKRSCEDKVSEETGREQVDDPVLDLIKLHIETRRDDTTLVQTTVQVDDDLARTVIINNFELSDVSCDGRKEE